ncbi:hypothetical protein D9Q98_004055 [Chlorella vulgaris]|uniref:Uncharacterized protein n=1 Tax=Chlorella vulgaris TaxID=3077 RepID=A0A9D4YY73_CHLVU|nr:hypothetical protein D9Q98_004055 [Chlorella vulgaris]
MARHYTQTELTFRLSPAHKEGKVYVSAVEPAVSVQTPSMELKSTLDAGVALFGVSDDFARFLQQAEQRIIEDVLERKEEVLRKPLTDEFLQQKFKHFLVSTEDAPVVLKARVSDGLAVFDASGTVICAEEVAPGTRVRGVLDLVRVCFGKSEWGAMWRLSQVQALPTAVCLLTEEPTVTEEATPEVVTDDEDLAAAIDEYV